MLPSVAIYSCAIFYRCDYPCADCNVNSEEDDNVASNVDMTDDALH